MMTQERKKILITGAAGKIGQWFAEYFGSQHDLLLNDKRKLQYESVHPFVKCDITNLKKMRALCEQVDIVIHLGANSDPKAQWQELLKPNIVGAYTVFQAAHEAGCRRMIFASSIHAVQGYPDDVQVHLDMPVRPPNLYGATKVWGEALGRYYADQKDLPTICVRIGWAVKKDNKNLWPQSRFLHMAITYEDLAQLFSCCLNAPDDLRFAIVHGQSDNRWKRLDISRVKEELGYEPVDDAFQIAEEKAEKAGAEK